MKSSVFTSCLYLNKIEFTVEPVSQQIFGGMTIGTYLKSILCQFQSHSKNEEIKKYFDSHPIKEAERSIQQGNIS